MKKLLLLFALFTVFASTAYSQVARRVLVEEFTSSTCPPCAVTDPIMEEFEASYLEKITVLKWHVNWPQPGNDPFYAKFKGSVARSTDYYDNIYAPQVFFNGGGRINPGNGVAALEGSVDDAAAAMSPFSIDIAQSFEGDSMIVNVTVKAEGSAMPAEPDLQLAMVVAERFAIYKGTNGAPIHTSVVRTVRPGLSTTGGLLINATNPAFTIGVGETKQYRFAVKIDPAWNADQLMAVAFIQAVESQEIFQTNWTVPLVTLTTTDKFMDVGSEAGYTVDVHNKSSNPITLKLSLDPMTSPTEWNLKIAEADTEGKITIDANEIKPIHVTGIVGEAYGYAPFGIFANTSAGIGTGGVYGRGLGKDTRDIIINAGALSATKIGQVERAFGDYGYRPVTFDYIDFDDAFADDWSKFRTIFYLADNKNGAFSYTAYLPIARAYMEAGGNFLLSSSNLIGAYYDASVAQSNDIFITSLQDNFNLTPEESVQQVSWGQLEGIPGDPISNNISSSITGMATTQRLSLFNTTDGAPIFKNENGDVVGVRSNMGDGKMVFMSFGFDKFATKDSAIRKTTISKILDWFAGASSVKVNDIATNVTVMNAPNPVSEMTTFTYSITEPTVVNLAVYDIMGREVARMISNESHSTGTYEAELNAAKLSNGTYTYVLSAGMQKVSGTMIVQK